MCLLPAFLLVIVIYTVAAWFSYSLSASSHNDKESKYFYFQTVALNMHMYAFINMYGYFPGGMTVHHMCSEPLEGRHSHHIPWNWNYRVVRHHGHGLLEESSQCFSPLSYLFHT